MIKSAVSTAWGRTLGDFPLGKVFIISFGIAIILGHFYMQRKKRSPEPRP